MRNAFLIARQEFVKYVTRRGFFISILMFPLWVMFVVLLPQWTGGAPQRVFTIVDRAGGYREAILEALAREDAGRELTALAGYANANADMAAVRRAAPQLARMLAMPQAARSIAAFRMFGGSRIVLSELARFTKPSMSRRRPSLNRSRTNGSARRRGAILIPADCLRWR